MSEVTRLYRYKSLLVNRRAVPASEIISELEISPATFKRDLAKLRDQLHVPITFDRDLGGYRLEQGHTDSELPGFWFSPEDVLALLTIEQMLTQLEPGLLGPKLKPLQTRLTDMLKKQGINDGQLAERIRLLQAGKRQVTLKNFEAVATATLARKQISITHYNRQNNEHIARTVSPRQLVYCRDNWYLDAWCHMRKALRSFSVDAVTACEELDDPAFEVDADQLRVAMQSSYCIFSGEPKAWVKLKFSPQRSRWVSRETWHPNQRAYSDERELLGDILRFGSEVEVLEPQDLRNRIKQALHEAARRYV